jgi:hypothetical protein
VSEKEEKNKQCFLVGIQKKKFSRHIPADKWQKEQGRDVEIISVF